MMDLSHPDFLRCGSWAHGRMHARGTSLELRAWDSVELGSSPVMYCTAGRALKFANSAPSLIRLSPNKAEIMLERRGNDASSAPPTAVHCVSTLSAISSHQPWLVYSGSLGSELHQAHCHLPNSSLSLGIGNRPLPRQYTLSPNAF